MRDLTQYILPYPYEAYDHHCRSILRDFDEYRNMIYGWVEKNTFNVSTDFIIDKFDKFGNIQTNQIVKLWVQEHPDKVRYIPDFSGLAFGICIDERVEKVYVRYPHISKEEDKVLYPDYDQEVFESMDITAKLDWMNEHCVFIPFRVLHEIIEVGGDSYKFSHIKNNNRMMQYLSEYLSKLDFQPKDDVYYYICANKHGFVYLKRDLNMSPKEK